ncbi:hypothetical protein FEZ61_07735 [Pseudomonas sp. MS15a(2019)]|nr:hypothetical protein [Pseudomonas sp. MS15a(2019)]
MLALSLLAYTASRRGRP